MRALLILHAALVCMFAFPKRLFAFVLFAALAVMHAGALPAQWVQTNGPYGGAIYALAMNSGDIFAGTYDGTVFRSTDGGLSWSLRSHGLSGGAVYALASIGTNLFEGGDSGVYVSSDEGANWHSINNGIPSTIQGHELVRVLVADGTNLFAATEDSGMYRSSDGGNSWVSMNGNLWPTVYITAFAVHDSDIFAGTYGFGRIGDIFRTTDEGTHWSESNIANTQTTDELYAMDSRLFAGTEDGVYVSTDNGVSWIQCGLGGQSILTLTGNGSKLYAGTFGGVAMSTDSGESWGGGTLKGMTDPEVFSLLSNDSVLIAGGYSGVFNYIDSAQQWENSNSGLIGTSFCWLQPEGTSLVGGSRGLGGIWRTTDDGASWDLSFQGDGEDSYCFAMSGSYLYSGGYGEVDLSLDSGASWAICPFLPVRPVVPVLGIATLGTYVYAGTHGDGIYRSVDSGISWIAANANTSWIAMNDGLSGNALDINSLTSIGTNLFAGTDSGVYRSTDSSNTWLSASSGLPSNAVVLAFAKIGSNLFAGTADNGIMRSTDSGNSWTPVNSGLPNNSIHVDALTASGGNLIVSTYSNISGKGLYFSTDEGASWASIGDGLSDYVSAVAVHDTELFVGTAFTGVWRGPLSDFGISSVTQTPVITSPDLRIYPNPFSQSTTISFTSEAAGYADVSIVNLLGAEVAHLFAGELAAGEHSFTWSKPTGLPDGMYECLVRMNGRVETLPVVLAR